jgi:predicted transcriptional regulator
MASMEAYYQRNRTNNAAAAYVLQSAYNAAKMHRIGRDGRDKDWCSNTTKAFDGFRASTNEAVGSIEADMAAECAYLAIDEQLKAKFDYDAGFHRYSGVIDKVKIAFDKDMKEANDVWFPKLQAVIETYASPKWSVAARARQGSLYDSCRTGLYNATPPAVKLYTDKEEKLLKLAEESDRDDLLEQADAIRQNRREQWRSARERSLEDADKAMVKFYAESVVWARGYKVRTPAVDHAIRRLAFFTDILGNQKMRDYSPRHRRPEHEAALRLPGQRLPPLAPGPLGSARRRRTSHPLAGEPMSRRDELSVSSAASLTRAPLPTLARALERSLGPWCGLAARRSLRTGGRRLRERRGAGCAVPDPRRRTGRLGRSERPAAGRSAVGHQ